MHPDELKQSLRQSALDWARERGFDVDASPRSAVLFKNVGNAFCPASFDAISKSTHWRARTKKPHQNIANVMEMQSSNSSDALLMNIFCHPMLASWKGVAAVLGFQPENPVFGFQSIDRKKGHKRRHY